MRFLQRKGNLIIAGTCIVYLFSGCAKAPVKELAAAKAAIETARNAEADKYMSRNFQNLLKALEASEAEIANQQSSFFMTRKYKRVTEMLVKTASMATDLANEAPQKKAEMIAQVKENLGLVKGMLEETAKDIKKAPRSTGKEVIAELKADLSTAESAAATAATEFDAGNIFGASDNLAEVQRLMKKITDTLKPKPEA
jgi:hypothetical protein